MNRYTVLLLFGGESSEHEVSIASARNVLAAINHSKYEVLLGFIDRKGKWWLLDDFEDFVYPHGVPQLVPVLGGQSFVTIPAGKVLRPDVILPILHGKNGEDGSVQGLAQLLHIPIVGCDVTASALCMDKISSKELLKASGFRIVPYETYQAGQEIPEFSKLLMRFGSPMFVKPSRAGSSVGVSKVSNEDELEAALSLASQHDERVLIEAGMSGREIEVAVLGNPPYHQASVPGEVRPNGDFYDYELKYSANSEAQLLVPAELSPELAQKVRSVALDAYALHGCRGLARADFFLEEDGTLYVNELNTLPGFTNNSMYPKLWRESGIGYTDLIERLISVALEPTMRTNETEE